MKKIILSSMAAIVAAGSANAGGLYISPKISWNHTRIDESRIEKAWNAKNGAWSEFSGNKNESWSGHGNKLTPKIAIGYDFNLDKYGIFSLEAEYGKTSNHFNPSDAGTDFTGSIPNDTDTRIFAYDESTISLNAKYGYKIHNVIPFITVGIGYTTIDSENNFRSGTYWWDTTAQTENVSWNIGAGVEVPVGEKVALTLSYLYTDLGNVEYSNWMYHEKGTANGIERHFDSNVDLAKHEVMAGVKISF